VPNETGSDMHVTNTPTGHPTVDRALDELSTGEKTWASLPLSARRALLERVRDLTAAHAEEWVTAATAIKELDPSSPLVGEEWISGPYAFAGGAATLAHSLASLETGTSPIAAATFGSAPGGRTTVRVLPLGIFDRLLLNGFSAEVWLQPGTDVERARQTAGLAQLDPAHTHGIGAVLGAGNIMSIAPLDTLYELFAHNRVVALKLNPITDPMLPVFTKVLAPLIEVGAVRVLTGGAELGTYLVNHAAVHHVHMTGSSITHDTIVFGPGQEGAARRAANDPVLNKPMTSELGGVSPTIVLPGEWSDADIKYQAEHVATQRLHNGGYNCVASQVVVLSSKWKQRDQFVAALRTALNNTPGRNPYYPGSANRVEAALTAYPHADKLGSGRVLIHDIDPTDEATLLQTEYFAPVLGIVELPHADEAFAAAAVRTANSDFVGTLGINIIAHPRSIQQMGTGFDILLAELNYGTIAVNAWTGVGFLTAGATWGAFPGHTIDDIQSGMGMVHNALLIDGAERTVVRGPFRPAPRSIVNGEWTISPKPPWFVTNRTAATTGQLLTAFAAKPSWTKLPGIFASALRG